MRIAYATQEIGAVEGHRRCPERLGEDGNAETPTVKPKSVAIAAQEERGRRLSVAGTNSLGLFILVDSF